MALVLVQHDISGVVVELDESQLAHPVLGPHYKRVRVNARGKVYAWGTADPDKEELEKEAAELAAAEQAAKKAVAREEAKAAKAEAEAQEASDQKADS